MRPTWRNGGGHRRRPVAAAGCCTTTEDRMTEMYGAGGRSHTPVWSPVVTSSTGASALLGEADHVHRLRARH
ncbi:hypothetical protein [Nocardioides sp.]|uniref:hypothetical protein n=1 Tax=Nocardioides sp. TaxID=35761 RepID=UPI0025D7D1D6|nr:hypothetical protein [Nocardioides sp.]